MAQNAPENQIIIDPTGQWVELCEQFNVDPATVIGKTLAFRVEDAKADPAIFLWMMDQIFPVRELATDYSGVLAGGGL